MIKNKYTDKDHLCLGLEKEDEYIRAFIGTTYTLNLKKIKTVGQLRSLLEQIIADMANVGDEREICDASLHKNKLSYILKKLNYQPED